MSDPLAEAKSAVEFFDAADAEQGKLFHEPAAYAFVGTVFWRDSFAWRLITWTTLAGDQRIHFIPARPKSP